MYLYLYLRYISKVSSPTLQFGVFLLRLVFLQKQLLGDQLGRGEWRANVTFAAYANVE